MHASSHAWNIKSSQNIAKKISYLISSDDKANFVFQIMSGSVGFVFYIYVFSLVDFNIMFSNEEHIVFPTQFLYMNDISKFHSAEMDNCLAG